MNSNVKVERLDIINSPHQAIVNPVNCVGVMGRGLALQFKRLLPKMFEAYVQDCRNGRVQLGKVTTYVGEETPHVIINFPTKYHWSNYSSLQYIESGLIALVECCEVMGITSIALPALGCGEGHLEFDKVLPLIVRAFEATDIEVTVCVWTL